MNSEVFRDFLSGQISSSHRSEQTSCNKCFLFKQSCYLRLFRALGAFWLLNADDLKYVNFPALVFQSAKCSYTYMKLYLEEVRHHINSITFKLKGICTFFFTDVLISSTHTVAKYIDLYSIVYIFCLIYWISWSRRLKKYDKLIFCHFCKT